MRVSSELTYTESQLITSNNCLRCKLTCETKYPSPLGTGCWNKIFAKCTTRISRRLNANRDSGEKTSGEIWSSVSKVVPVIRAGISGFLLSCMKIQVFYFRSLRLRWISLCQRHSPRSWVGNVTHDKFNHIS